MNKTSNNGLKEFQKKIGYKFRDITLLERALTHSSYANENRAYGVLDNERLEFLGDSVLGMNTALHLFSKYPDEPEGELTKMYGSARKPRKGDFARRPPAPRTRRGKRRRQRTCVNPCRCI